MPIANPTATVRIGSRVSYEDMANPRSVGRVIAVDLSDPCCAFTVRWDDDSPHAELGETESTSDLRQYGWSLVADLPGNPFDGVDIISMYTRAQALEDGELVDVSDAAREVGIAFPVAMTRAAFADCVTWDDHNAALKDERGRLHDVVWMTRCAIRRTSNTDRLTVTLYRVPNTPQACKPQRVTLVAVCGPGDDAEPVITIMQPDES